MPTNKGMWQNLCVCPYTKKVAEILGDLRHSEHLANASASGVSAAFECGAAVRFAIVVDTATKQIRRASYETNGCGHMIAASECVARAVRGRNLTDLHGAADLERISIEAIDPAGSNRLHCIQVSASAFRNALADYRWKVVEEFQGEMALICTCFGVTEDTIVKTIEKTHATEVSEVSAACRAGSGCGSCRMLIQELIDGHTTDFAG